MVWDTDPVLGATQIEINGDMMDMTKAHAQWLGSMQAQNRVPRYRNLYSLYLAQLAGFEPDAYPV